MIFSSCFFLFIFLPITYILHCICPNIKLKNMLLIIASLIFYAFGEPIYVFLMIGSILMNYLLARLIAAKTQTNIFFLILAIVLNIGMLIIFKYSGLLITTINSVSF